jgi:hypothetical protein
MPVAVLIIGHLPSDLVDCINTTEQVRKLKGDKLDPVLV